MKGMELQVMPYVILVDHNVCKRHVETGESCIQTLSDECQVRSWKPGLATFHHSFRCSYVKNSGTHRT